MDASTGARWSELVGLQVEEYDEVNRAIVVRRPLRESGGRLAKASRAKTPAGKRWVQLPDFLDVLYRRLPGQRGRRADSVSENRRDLPDISPVGVSRGGKSLRDPF
ncbi:hypothetical protein ACFPZ0_06570 [Streptomonospora nanhaiensis]|uniref:Integrase n=1 Tax=Streptomonospora nanhaiensis TaxID=1323731 RepID=A0A853BJ63_9ACTN|nr:hypothetical protein [Streptomonospora nanhaiensis]MBV2364109.1 hypothetical protein [Streptomonospora nanhaiensis]MBX9388493.1 hypothetical protein [Streptomonospora nanhaiensis]NYI95060.1 integrase [Streptomonospora nanhaiensis]